jgi:oligopeptide transport system permease protein
MAQAVQSLPRTQTSASTLPPSANQSQWALAWRRLRRNKAALAGGVIIFVYILIAILAPSISPHNPTTAYSGKDQMPPFYRAQSPAGRVFDPAFVLGTDNAAGGRDILSRIFYGTRTSLVAGLLPAIVVLLIGSAVGFVSGLLGGTVDNILMRITDIFYAIPSELFLILVMVTLGESPFGKSFQGVPLFLTSLAILSWSGLARLMRSSALSLKGREFVDAARSVGASSAHIIFRHVLPNSIGILVVWIAFAIPRFIIAEAILGYIGLGLKPSISGKEFFVTSWGRQFLDAYSTVNGQPDYLLVLAVAVSILVISFTFFGDGLRDALDPRMKK